ncbi:MAG: acyl-CoA dehydrogenase family protein [Candidatus Binatia bacterium]
MYLDFTPEQKQLRDQLRAYFAEMMTPELVAEVQSSGEGGGGPLYHQALQKMGADGWIGVGWPKQYGGQGRTPIEQFIFSDEVQRAGFPLPFLTINSVGNTIMEFGTDEQKQEFLPRILQGKLHVAIGYTEPGAGTDLASLRTRAVKDGDDYVINGNKVFTSLANYSDYIWLAARTDPDAPKHAGISIFLVDTKLPGFKLTPIWTMAGVRTNATYFEDVRVPKSALVGGENMGWSLIVNQLNHERIALMTVGLLGRHLEEVRCWARASASPTGAASSTSSGCSSTSPACAGAGEALRLLAWRQAWCMTNGGVNFADASTVKVYASEYYVDAYRLLMEVLGQRGMLRRDSAAALLHGRVEMLYRAMLILTFGGGTNEVQRDIIAMAGLQMPRSIRRARKGTELADFAFTEEQEALRQLARTIFTDHCAHEQLRAVEATPEWFHRAAWDDLAKANLLGVAPPGDVGGSGLSLLDLCLLLEEQGAPPRRCRCGRRWCWPRCRSTSSARWAQRQRWLPGVARGEIILTAALTETGWDDPASITATATRDGAPGAWTAPRPASPPPTWRRASSCRRAPATRQPASSWSTRRPAACAWRATPPPTASRSSRSSWPAPPSAPTTCSATCRAAARSSTGLCAPSPRCAR